MSSRPDLLRSRVTYAAGGLSPTLVCHGWDVSVQYTCLCFFDLPVRRLSILCNRANAFILLLPMKLSWIGLLFVSLLSSAQAIDPPALFGRRGGSKTKQPQQPAAVLEAPAADVAPTTNGNGHNNYLVVAGTIGKLLNRLRKVRFRHVILGLHRAFHFGDVAWLLAWGWLPEPLAQQVFKRQHSDKDPKDFQSVWWGRAAHIFGQLGQVASLIYACDMVTVVATKCGFYVPPGLNDKIAKLSYTLWAGYRVRRMKRWWLRKVFHDAEGQVSVRTEMTSRLLDGVLAVVVALVAQDIFQVTIGQGLQSIFAIGGLSTLILSLASKDVAQMIVSGLVINSGDKFIVGESVELGDGTKGTVHRLGIFEMQLRGGDGVVTRIPNGQVVNQRVRNLSRTTESMVVQQLWFRYEDIEHMPEVLAAIKREVQASCPHLITDGSRAFRAFWTEFQDDHLEAVVEAHFTLKPGSEDYHEERQLMLQAIARAVKESQAEFALPTSIVKSPSERMFG